MKKILVTLILTLSFTSALVTSPLIDPILLKNDTTHHFDKIVPVPQLFWYDKLTMSSGLHYESATNFFEEILNNGIDLLSTNTLDKLNQDDLRRFIKQHPATQLSYNPALIKKKSEKKSPINFLDYRYSKKILVPKWNSPTTARTGLVELRWKLPNKKSYQAIDGFIATKRVVRTKKPVVIFKLAKTTDPVFFDYETSRGRVMYTIYAYRGKQRSKGYGLIYSMNKPYKPLVTEPNKSIPLLNNATQISLVNQSKIKNSRLVMVYTPTEKTSPTWIKVSMKRKKEGWARYSLITPVTFLKVGNYLSLLNVYVKEGYYYNDWDTFRIKTWGDESNITGIEFLTRGGGLNKNLIIKNGEKVIFHANYRLNSSYNYIPVSYKVLDNNGIRLNLLSRLYQTNDPRCCPSFRYQSSFLYSEKNNGKNNQGKFLFTKNQLTKIVR